MSTSGIVPLIPKVASELGVALAISLHATNDTLRSELMPINKSWPLTELLNACREYASLAKSALQRITFEYVMLDGVNDDPYKDARDLIKLLNGIPSHINLLPFHSWPQARYSSSPMSRIQEFSQVLIRAGMFTTIRRTRGEDIMAACGQLKSSLNTKNAFRK